MPGAWCQDSEAALGGTLESFHGAVRGAGDRVVEGGEPEGGGGAVKAELGRDPRHYGAGRAAWFAPAASRTGGGNRCGREGVSERAQLSHAGERSGSRARAVCGRGAEAKQLGWLLGNADGRTNQRYRS